MGQKLHLAGCYAEPHLSNTFERLPTTTSTNAILQTLTGDFGTYELNDHSPPEHRNKYCHKRQTFPLPPSSSLSNYIGPILTRRFVVVHECYENVCAWAYTHMRIEFVLTSLVRSCMPPYTAPRNLRQT